MCSSCWKYLLNSSKTFTVFSDPKSLWIIDLKGPSIKSCLNRVGTATKTPTTVECCQNRGGNQLLSTHLFG